MRFGQVDEGVNTGFQQLLQGAVKAEGALAGGIFSRQEATWFDPVGFQAGVEVGRKYSWFHIVHRLVRICWRRLTRSGILLEEKNPFFRQALPGG